ncbi:MAG: NUDIX domain-containing protein [Microthrixaceae bacterium]
MTADGPAPQVAVGAVVVVDDHLLLVRRGQPPQVGRWSLPGGRVQHGELLAEAVVRELAEETGIAGVCDEQIGVAELVPSPGDDHQGHYVVIDFAVTPLDSHHRIRAGSDAAEVRWVPTWDVAELDLTPGLAEFLSEHGVIDTIAR